MDLTKNYPASVSAKIHGIVQLQRAIDKGKAVAHGLVGEYNWNCPMDVAVFEFLRIDHAALLAAIRDANDDAEIADYVAPFVRAKSASEIEAWNDKWLNTLPTDGHEASLFLQLRNELCPERTDIVTFPALIDFEEHRLLPHAVAQPVSA